VQVSLHSKKLGQIDSLCSYLLTDFFDLKTANSSTESAGFSVGIAGFIPANQDSQSPLQ
jgi:hypothetical protein